MSAAPHKPEIEALADVLGAELYESLMEASADQWRRWCYLTDAAKEVYRAEAERIILGAFMPAVERIVREREAKARAEALREYADLADSRERHMSAPRFKSTADGRERNVWNLVAYELRRRADQEAAR